MHAYNPNPASMCGSVIIYEAENIPLSSGNPPGCSLSPLLSYLMYSPPQISHFDEMTGSTSVSTFLERVHYDVWIKIF